MLSKLPFIDDHHRELLQEVISRIVEALQPEKIICYGVRVTDNNTWSCFLPEESNQTTIVFDLLIIIREARMEKESGLLDRISKFQCDVIRIVPVIHGLLAVYEAMQRGSRFFNTACHSGMVIYDSGNAPLPDYSEYKIDVDRRLIQIKQYWSKWFVLGEKFYQSACESAAKGNHEVAVFMLHQVVELTCIASLRSSIGYKPNTHNLKRLLALMGNYASHVQLIFPESTHEEAELFNMLHRAYSDVRYREEYEVIITMVFTLIERVGMLQKAVAELYQRKVVELNAMKTTGALSIPD